jgi:hypothetical protein
VNVKTTASVHKIQIERVIEHFEGSSVARFYWEKMLLCEAWFAEPDMKKASFTHVWISIEEASAVSIAITMAIEWLSEQGEDKSYAQ